MKNIKDKIKFSIFATMIGLFFTACGGAREPKVYDYSAFLQSKPKSILVLMPTNETTEIKGSAAVLANAVFPLAEAGYYVFSPALVYETFRNNGLYEPNEIHHVPLQKLKQIFGADAVLYLNVKSYGSNYMVLDSVARVQIEARLVDISSGALLWQNSITMTDNSSKGGGDLLGIIITAAIKQVADTLSDTSFKLSEQAELRLFGMDCYDCILRGPYSPSYGRDIQLKNKETR